MSPIPLAPPCFSGALNFHGNIVAVLNLDLLLGLADQGNHGKIIMLQQEISSLAFLVDFVVRIVSEDEVTVVVAHDASFASARLGLIDGEAIQLNLEAIVREAENQMQKSL
jgi:chemotaxis signal transduction protein